MVSNLSLRSPPMTSGLFNTDDPGDSLTEFTSFTSSAVQPDPSAMFKFTGHDEDFSAENFDPDFDMNIFGGLDAGFDPLGDASLDSFTDLNALLSQNTLFLNQLEDEKAGPLMDFNTEFNASSKSVKRSFDEMEAGSSTDLDQLSASVDLAATPSSPSDHDYSTKRPRMSDVKEEALLEDVFLHPTLNEEALIDDVFIHPTLITTPTLSTSVIVSEPLVKVHGRREKNNVASKRSREVRKLKFVNMEGEAEQLIADNARLEKRAVQLERLAKEMKEILVAKMAGK